MNILICLVFQDCVNNVFCILILHQTLPAESEDGRAGPKCAILE